MVLLEDFLKINWYRVVAEKKENEKDQNGAERKRSSMGDQGAKKY